MSVFTPAQFSRKQTLDIETSIAAAVHRAIDKHYPGPGGIGEVAFAQIFDDWPSFDQAAVLPAAVSLPDGDLLYARSYPTPVLLEDTWEPQGEPGFGLYQLGEVEREFEIQVRGATAAERDALKAGVEGAFINDGVIATGAGGFGNGIKVDMPEYWGLPAWITLISSRKLDDAESAARNMWEARFRLHAQTKHVVLRPVQVFRLRITEVVGGDPPPS